MTQVGTSNVYKYDVYSCNNSGNLYFRLGVNNWTEKEIAPGDVNVSLSVDQGNSSDETTPTASASDWKTYLTSGVSNRGWVVTFDSEKYDYITLYVDISDKKKIWVTGTPISGSYTDTEFEMVATAENGEQLVLPLTCMRNRTAADSNTDLSSTHFSVGFKDELLPGETDKDVQIFVRGKNNPNAQFRPLENQNLGDKYDLLPNTLLSDMRNFSYITGVQAKNSSNTFAIKKGTGASYTVALNLGDEITQTGKDENPKAYTIKAQSLTLYTNKSLDDYYRSLFTDYKNSKDVRKNSDLEDYYMFGCIYGNKTDDSYKGGYMTPTTTVSETDKTIKWTRTDNTGKTVSDYFKMEKHIYLNPDDKNVVDSIVYTKVIKKPNVNAGYEDMYMQFAPKSLVDAITDGTYVLGDNAGSYSTNDAWNYTIRPEVFDQQDGTAIKGSVLVSGTNGTDRRNGEQSFNPVVDNDKEYYIIRLNTTTSTYRVQFVNADKITVGTTGIRTFCSRFNYVIPTGYAAYAAHSFEEDTEHQGLSGQQPNGIVKLRRLKFIPANEPVVLVYKQYFDSPFETGRESVSEDFTMLTDDNDEKHYLEADREAWWSKGNYPSIDVYNNLLVAVLDPETIDNGKYHMVDGKYHYDSRNFALNMFSNTAFYKEKQRNNENPGENYIGFFRADGYVRKGYAYLRLNDQVLTFNGQLLGDLKGNIDELPDISTGGGAKAVCPSKFSFDFDVAPWDDVTAIHEVRSDSVKDNAYYNLQGIRVAHPSKGIYIHQGKKVVFK